jgi:drug/metabolite transporter (DMT)-like permease
LPLFLAEPDFYGHLGPLPIPALHTKICHNLAHSPLTVPTLPPLRMPQNRAWRLKVIAAFATVYLVWGSTYLAIRIGVASLPPALFAGVRFLVAGLLLAAYARFSGKQFPRRFSEWITISVAALLLLVGANGLVVWGEQWVPSNQAALIVATLALWLAWFGVLGPQGESFSRRRLVGLLVGFAGVAVLMWPTDGFVLEHFSAQLAILLAALSWAAGSIYMKRRRPSTPPLMAAAMQSLVAGVLLGTIGYATGEAGRWTWEGNALLALIYLIVFGSCLAYVAYLWLLHEVSPAALGTYAYINPAVAVLLGWWLLDESLSAAQIIGMCVVLLGVLLVSLPAGTSKLHDGARAP